MRGMAGRSVLLAALAVIAAPAAGAHEDDGGVTVVGHRRGYAEETVTSATKTPRLLRDTPQSVSVVTSDLIEDQAMHSMADVVHYVPGVAMGQGEGHRDAPTLRGNSSTADFYVDGVRDDVQYYRDLYNAERIEVLKGPNAMIFGRGGGGGVINRVTEWADWTSAREVSVQVGGYDQYRIGADLAAPLADALAARLNLVYEDAGSYRDYAVLERYGANPTGALRLSENTELRVGYEYFYDERTVDRGVPSQNGRPYAGSRSAFFGNPRASVSETRVHMGVADIKHAFTPSLRLRNHTSLADYEKFYQNVHANSSVSATGDVSLQAYNSGSDRWNMFNQTDLIWETKTGPIGHTILAGVELGRQETDNTRTPNNNSAGVVTIAAPTTFTAPVFLSPLQSDNHVDVDLAAIYVQDEIALTDKVQVIAGLRFDRFDLSFDDRRAANADFSRVDEFVSPRVGLVYKPATPVTLYASYSVSYLPQSGDQFGSLDATSSALDPEEFENFEIGAKWDLPRNLSLSAAIYRLDRTNTRALDPLTNLTVLTGAQRSEGVELGVSGNLAKNWQVIGGYAYQNVEITRTTSAAPAGRVVPLTPEHVFSLWNNVRVSPRWGAGLGVIHQSESFASISNAVTLPEFTRVDAALFVAISESVDAQLNIENLFDETYWGTAHNDNNITPGSPFAVRVALKSRF